jgi:hypothetical protein
MNPHLLLSLRQEQIPEWDRIRSHDSSADTKVLGREISRTQSALPRDSTNPKHRSNEPVEQFYRITRGKPLQVEINILGSPHEHSRSILTPKPLGHLGGRREGESEANLGSRADLLGRSPRLSYPSPAGCVAAASCPRAWCGETRRPAKKTRGDSSEEERNENGNAKPIGLVCLPEGGWTFQPIKAYLNLLFIIS